jgi:hypothetical protein
LPGVVGDCNLDIFFGGLWWQRIKQLLLHNNVAVMVVNPYYFDSWEAWDSVWDAAGSYDPPVFKALADFLAPADVHASDRALAPPLFRDLNRNNVAFHGWSGGAQMVSYLIELAASGHLPGLGVAAGVMTAGGSYGCYDTPPAARGVCSNCSASHNLVGCSSDLVKHGIQPACSFCCPNNFTEAWYESHPEDYASHPWTFLAQTEIDGGSDSCAGKHYHETMLAHGAHSELHIIPLDRMRCYSIGDPDDPDVPAFDTFAKFCANPNMTSLNHSIADAAMVGPVVKFLLKAFGNRSAATASAVNAAAPTPTS